MLHKRLDYGHNGFQVPFIPRAARSSRRRSLVQKTAEDNQLCAFDLLATVAGKILLEEDSSHLTAHGSGSSCLQNILKEENKLGDQSPTVDHFDQGSVEAVSPSLTLELGLRGLDQGRNVKEASEPLCNVSLAPSSAISLSNGLRKNGSLVKIDLNADFRCHLGVIGGNGFNSQSFEDPEILDRKPPTIVSSNNSVKVTSVNDKDRYPYSSQSPCRNNNVNVVSRDDDDENSSECIQPSTMKTARLPARASDRRTRKLLASKYWRLASKARDGDLSDNGVHCLYHSKKAGYKHPRSQRIYPFKKRKFYHYNSLSSSRADFGFKGAHNYPRKAIGTTASGCIAGQSTSFSSRDSHVKLRIKSFRVPELFIEMPETATIGSLKRTVMEAISALLGGGLHVGVLNQGKKIRDDNRTLLQSGICNGNKAGSLGFSLEPNPSKVGAPVFSEGNSLVHMSTDFPQPVSRCPIPNLNVVHQGASQVSADPFPTSLIESDYDSAPSTTDVSAEKGTVDSRALVALPEGTPRPLSVIHSHQKSKRSEMGQRRIRRPFSVSEVEALVLAVEKLGTGRWRDVKMRAFENVKHRTYVDLKDKWKTLVHTATIAPQQRRGQPVPQELLDRVLAAHGYWTQHHAKQSSSHSSMTCLFL